MRLLVRGLGALLAAGAIAGCGDTNASQEELALARQEARQVGREEARANAAQRIRVAHANGFLDGMKRERNIIDEVDEEVTAEEEAEREELGAYDSGGYINPTPLKENGEPSYEFEPDDIERAEEADAEIREYCEGAVSEAQEVGCLGHVEPWEVP